MAGRRRMSLFPADVVVESIETLECCLVCTNPYDQGRMLDCKHIFCEQCLKHHYKTYRSATSDDQDIATPPNGPTTSLDSTRLACPTCRKITVLPSNGLAARSLESSRQQPRVRKISKPATSVTPTPDQNCEPCFYNGKAHNEADFYCAKCTMNFCNLCRGIHDQADVFRGHTMIHITNKENLNLSCDRHGKLPSVYYCTSCKKHGCTICIINEHKMHVTGKLQETLSTMREEVKVQLNELGKKLEVCKSKMKQKLNKSTTHSPVSHTPTSDMDSLSVQPTVMTNGFRKDSNDNMDYEVRAIQREIDNIQKLYDMAFRFTESSQSQKLLVLFDELKTRLQAVCEVELEKIQEDIITKLQEQEDITDSTGPQSRQSSNSNSVSTLTTLPDDEPSGFLLHKLKEKWKFEKQRSDPGELFYPAGVDFYNENCLVVTDYDGTKKDGEDSIVTSNKLRFYDASGQQIAVQDLQKLQPLAIKVVNNDLLAVTDNYLKQVKLLNIEGRAIKEFGKGDFGWPYGITCNSKGQYIVTDNFHDTVYIFSPEGRRVKQFGVKQDEGLLRNPMHVAVNSRDDIVIADTGNNCIKIYDALGGFRMRNTDTVRSVNAVTGREKKSKKRKLHGPRGIAVDKKDNILVTDDHGRVCMYTAEGQYVRNLLTEEDFIKYPEALATNPHGLLAVTEYNPNNMCAIRIFSMYE